MIFGFIKTNGSPTQDLHALTLTCRKFHATFNEQLYQPDGDIARRSRRQHPAIEWGLTNRCEGSIRRVIDFFPEMCDVFHVSRAILSAMYEVADELLATESVRAQILDEKNDLEHPMFAAVEQGHMDLIDRLTSIRPPPHDLMDIEGFTLLQYACLGGHVELVKRFLDEGADPAFERDFWFRPRLTALDLAICSENDEPINNEEVVFIIVEEILSRRPEMAQGERPLVRAAVAGHEDVFDLLLESGSQLPSGKVSKQALLHAAVEGNNPSIVKRVLALGVDQSPYPDIDQDSMIHLIETPLHIVARCKRISMDIAQLLVDYGANLSAVPTDDFDSRKDTVLESAVIQDNLPAAEFLLGLGAHLLERNSSLYTHIHTLEMAKLFIRLGVDVSKKEADGSLPLQKVTDNEDHIWRRDQRQAQGKFSTKGDRRFEVFRFFVENVTNINAVDDNYQTVLFYCCARSGVASDSWALRRVDILLKHGASLSAVDIEGKTPVHAAAKDGGHEVLDLLLDNEADVHATDNEGFTPLHDAIEGPPDDDYAPGFMDMLNSLLERGADPDAQSNDGTYVLYIPIRACLSPDHVDLMINLYKKYAKAVEDEQMTQFVNRPDRMGRLALVYSASSLMPDDEENQIANLLAAGADVNRPDGSGITPLAGAVAISSPGNFNPDIASVLLGHGADINFVNDQGFTALDVLESQPLCHYLVEDRERRIAFLRERGGRLSSELQQDQVEP